MPEHLPEHGVYDALQRLTGETTVLRTDLADTRTELRSGNAEAKKQTTNTRIGIGLIFVLLACTIAAVLTMTVANQRAIEANNRKFCPLIGLLGPSSSAPAATPKGRLIEQRAAELAKDPTFRCT